MRQIKCHQENLQASVSFRKNSKRRRLAKPQKSKSHLKRQIRKQRLAKKANNPLQSQVKLQRKLNKLLSKKMVQIKRLKRMMLVQRKRKTIHRTQVKLAKLATMTARRKMKKKTVRFHKEKTLSRIMIMLTRTIKMRRTIFSSLKQSTAPFAMQTSCQ